MDIVKQTAIHQTVFIVIQAAMEIAMNATNTIIWITDTVIGALLDVLIATLAPGAMNVAQGTAYILTIANQIVQ